MQTSKGELLFVEYDHDGAPMRMVTREKGGFSEWMRVPSKRDGCVYLRHDGAGESPEVEMHEWAALTPTTAVWWTSPITLTRFVRWDKGANGRDVAVRGTVEDADDLAALGRHRLAEPKPGDPFEGTEECDESLAYCAICDDDMRDDPEHYCDHLFDTEEGIRGPGSGEWDGEAPAALCRLVRRLGCARHLLADLTAGKYPRPHRYGSMLGPTSVRLTVGGMSLDGAFDRIADCPGDNEHELTEGLRWLESMDEQTVGFNAAVVTWLREEIAAQDARRASGERCYAVKTSRWGTDTTHGRGLSFADAMALVTQLRAADKYARPRVVRRVGKTK